MQRADERPERHLVDDPSMEDPLGLAFRELHGRTLHGFSLLLTLGDRSRAARLAADSLAAAEPHVDELRHPERAAAWLRAYVVRRLGRDTQLDLDDRLDALAGLGVDARVLAGLAALDRHERAAIIVAWVERLGRRDVATVVARDGDGLETLLRRARRRYLSGYAATRVSAEPTTAIGSGGPVLGLVRAAAARALP